MSPQYGGANDGILLILLPLAGVVGILIGVVAMNRIDGGAPLSDVRGLGTLALLASLAAAFPIAKLLYDVNQTNGMVRLEWGFWASAMATVAMLVGAIGLARDPVSSVASSPSSVPTAGQGG
jgi:uncharacterized BrkB/YihY/UPF0761 family membrane protein